MDELREKIARAVFNDNALFDLAPASLRESRLEVADRILDLPEIKEALEIVLIMGEIGAGRFVIVERKDGKLVAAHGVDANAAPGDSVTLPAVKLSA